MNGSDLTPAGAGVVLAVILAGLLICNAIAALLHRSDDQDSAHERLAYYLDPQHHQPPTREDITR